MPVLRRFYAERQILARLQHPTIAHFLDGGTFAGRPSWSASRGNRSSIIAGRNGCPSMSGSACFLPVCEAVEYAYGNLEGKPEHSRLVVGQGVRTQDHGGNGYEDI